MLSILGGCVTTVLSEMVADPQHTANSNDATMMCQLSGGSRFFAVVSVINWPP